MRGDDAIEVPASFQTAWGRGGVPRRGRGRR